MPLHLESHLRPAHLPLTISAGLVSQEEEGDESTATVLQNQINARAMGNTPVVNPRLRQLVSLAKELGFAVSPLETMRKELSLSISTRLVTRVGIDVYQTVAYNLPMFPRQAAIEIFPAALVTLDTDSVTTWRLETMAEVVSTLGPLLGFSKRCAGVSRALQTPSESVIRVIATLKPGIEISYVRKSGLDRLYINFQYAASIAPC